MFDAGDPPSSGAEPPAVLGVVDATFGALRALEGPPARAMYRLEDGTTHVFRLHRGGRNYYFPPDPADDDWPLAISMGLSGPE